MQKRYLFFSTILVFSIFFWALPALTEMIADTCWVRRYNGPGNNLDQATAIAVDGSGYVYVTGGSVGSESGWDYATIKYYPNGDTAWVRRYDGPVNSDDYAYAMAIDGSGNVYVTGKSVGSGTDFDYATIKYYPDGDTAWLRRYNGPGNYYDYAYAIAIDGSGNVYVTGLSVGSGSSGPDYATIKYNPDGDTAWVRRYDGPASSGDEAHAIAVDDSGNVYVTGWSQGSGTNDDYATIKYDANGETAWVRRYDGPASINDYAIALAVDDSGNILVTGFGVGIGTNYDYATIKYYPNGDTAWLRRYNGPSSDWTYAIAVDSSGNVYVTGHSWGIGTDLDYATIKYYPNGDTAWVRRYDGPGNSYDEAHAMAVDSSGNVYVTGMSLGSGTDWDYATLKYFPNGDTAWVRRYNGPGNNLDGANAIAVDGSGNVYVTGGSYGSGSDRDYATIKYIQNYFPTVLSPDSSVFLCTPDTIRFTVTATDPDSLDTLTLFGPGMPVPVTGVSPLSAEVSIYVSSPGTYNYVYTVTDSWGATDIDTSTWNITMDNIPTVTVPDSALFFCDPDTIRFTVRAVDLDAGDTMTLTGPGIDTYLQGFSFLSAGIKAYICSTGTYNFVYTVTDTCLNSDQDTATWNVIVNTPPNPFSLNSPLEADTVRMPITFNWQASTDSCSNDTIRYNLYLSRSISFHPDSTLVYDSLLETHLTDSPGNKLWYWKVRAFDKYGAERWSDQTQSLYAYVCGDCNTDGIIDIGDVIYLINYLYKDGPAPVPLAGGDATGGGEVDVGDVVYMINYLFKSGHPPCEP